MLFTVLWHVQLTVHSELHHIFKFNSMAVMITMVHSLVCKTEHLGNCICNYEIVMTTYDV